MANQRTGIIDKTTTVAGEQPSRRNNVKITPRVNSVAVRHVPPNVDGPPSVTPQLSQIPRTRADPGGRPHPTTGTITADHPCRPYVPLWAGVTVPLTR